nr:MAG TPA: hypothetical protein [Caudoviricetes sp.]
MHTLRHCPVKVQVCLMRDYTIPVSQPPGYDT